MAAYAGAGGGGSGRSSVRGPTVKVKKAPKKSPPRKSPPPYNPPPPRRAPTRGAGGGQSGGSRGSVGSPPKSPPASTPKPKPAPKPPSIKDWLAGDTTYQDVTRGQQRALGDFLADIGRQRTEAKTSFADVSRSMETEREKALEAMQDEFASRGLLKSGLFGEAQGDYQTDWQSQMKQLQQGQSSLLADLLSQRTNYGREQDLARESARQDAIRRRASKYGL